PKTYALQIRPSQEHRLYTDHLVEHLDAGLDRAEALLRRRGRNDAEGHDRGRPPRRGQPERGLDLRRERGVRAVVLQASAQPFERECDPHPMLEHAGRVVAPVRELRRVSRRGSVRQHTHGSTRLDGIGLRWDFGREALDDGLVLPEQDRSVSATQPVDTLVDPVLLFSCDR
ncbi:unnamed protein product, partial [Mycena citricolor]